MRDLIILRGAPGSGKSRFATMLADTSDDTTAEICSADHYFMRGGTYNFRPEDLDKAHAYCFAKVEQCMREGINRIILDNTNIEHWDFREYVELARKYGYARVRVVMERAHGGRNTHGVTPEAVERKARRLRETINL